MKQRVFEGEEWARVASQYAGQPVRVVFEDPFWFRGEFDFHERPTFEVFGRLTEVLDEGFAVVALNCDREPTAREGQFVFWALVREVEVLV